MTARRPGVKRSASVRRAVARSRQARLRRVERVVVEHLEYLRRHDPEAHAAFVECLRRVVERADGIGTDRD